MTLIGSCLALPFPARAACFPSPSGLVSWWTFDGDLSDRIGLNSAVAQGSPIFADGLVAGALQLDDVDDEVSVPAGPALDVGTGDGMTIEGWFKPQNPSANLPLVEWNNRQGDVGVHVWYSQGVQGAPGDIYANVIDGNGSAHQIATGPGLVTASEWYHVALTYDRASGTAAIYVNGVRRLNQVIGSFPLHTRYELFFGQRIWWGGVVRFVGSMDEWGLYSRALDETEVRGIFEAGSAGRCRTPTLAAIVTQPVDQRIFGGDTATLSVTAYGSPPLSFQWTKDGQPLLDATNSILKISNAPLSASGGYTVEVINPAGVVTSRVATVTVLERPPCVPSPAGLVSWWTFDVDAGDAIGINPGVASGTPALGNGKVDQALLFDGQDDDVSVAAANALDVGAGGGMTVEGWFKPQDPRAQRPLVEWNNRQGSVGVHLWVSQLGSGDLYANLVDVNNTSHLLQSAGGLVTSNTWYYVALTYDRASGIASLYLDGVAVVQQTIGSVSLHTSYDLFFGRRIYGGGSIWFQGAMDEWGLYSRAIPGSEVSAIYQAGPGGRCKVPIPPSITLQPVGQSVLAGDPVELTTAATGSRPLTFQWVKGDQALPDATNSTLRILNAPIQASGNYVVVVSNAGGAVTSQVAVVTVATVPPCLTPPSSLVGWWPFDEGAESVVGPGPVQYSGNPTISSAWVGRGLFLDGADDSSWVSAGPAIDVGTKPGLTIECWINPTSIEHQQPIVEWNNRTGLAGLHFWFSQEGSLGNGPGCLYANLVDSAGGSHYLNSPGGFVKAGEWQHVALTYDKATGKTLLYFNGSAVGEKMLGSFSAQTAPPYDLFFGQRIANGPFAFRYSGGLDEISLYGRALSGAEVRSIYRLAASGKCKDGLPPEVVSGPFDLVAGRGGEARFDVIVNGSRPLFYQWLFNDSPLADATQPSLVLSNVAPEQAGRYSVIVSNSSGRATSSNANLVVKPPPTVLQAGKVSASPGTSVSVPITAVIQGSEQSLAFSLVFDATKLAYTRMTLGAGLPDGSTLVLSPGTATSGKVGARLAVPAGSAWPTGTQVVAHVEFTVAPLVTDPLITVGFGDQPVAREILDGTGGTLLTTFAPGGVLVTLTRLRVVSVDGAAADTVEVPIELNAIGSENALGFSLQFDASKASYVGAALGSGAPAGSVLIANTNEASQGRVGLVLGLPANTSVAVGTITLITTRFRAGLFLNPAEIPIQFGDAPTARQVSDSLARRLTAVFSGGIIHVTRFEFEGDVTPRPDGDHSVGVTDWTQLGRYAAGFDVPAAEEFQRADCAPLESKGNGQISIADWVQAGRFYVGLDPITARGGPAGPEPPPQGGGDFFAAGDRSVRLVDQRVMPGASFVIPISLVAQGNENAFGFSVQFDPTVLEFLTCTNGPGFGEPILNVNSTHSGEGRLGITMALPLGTAIPSGNWQLLLLSFRPRASTEGTTQISFADQPVLREIVDATARTLSANFLGGTVSFGPPVMTGPRLDSVRSGANVIFLWPASATNFDLEMSSQLSAPNWSKVNITPVEVGGRNIISLGMSNAQQYFRLRQP